ncbi:hypothetical protein WN943_002324 [Citrus x changshan-huyou]
MGSSMASMKSVKLKALSLRRSLEALVRPLVVDDLKSDENLTYVGGNSPNKCCYNKVKPDEQPKALPKITNQTNKMLKPQRNKL